MKNLCITVHVVTPIITGKYPLNLDGLLYWAAYEGSNEDEARALEIVERALDSKQGVFASSDMIFIQTPSNGITQKEATFTTNFKWREYPYESKKKSIMESGGPYRARLTTYNAVGCSAVRFYARGNADLIRFLVESAGFIGRGNNQGHGEISEIVIDEIEQDLSWFRTSSDGKPLLQRCLPVEIAEGIDELARSLGNHDQTLIKCRPPYTKTQEKIGYSTDFLRETLSTL